MNHYSFDDISLGMSAEFDVKITQKQMEIFAELSGDFNPMHIDSEYAKNRGYTDVVAYGMLVSSFYSKLVGMYLPGEKCMLNKCAVNYRKPVYVGDVLVISGEVTDKRISTRRMKIKGKCCNQKGEAVNTAEITVSFTGD